MFIFSISLMFDLISWKRQTVWGEVFSYTLDMFMPPLAQSLMRISMLFSQPLNVDFKEGETFHLNTLCPPSFLVQFIFIVLIEIEENLFSQKTHIYTSAELEFILIIIFDNNNWSLGSRVSPPQNIS